jgi:hypothetical protein
MDMHTPKFLERHEKHYIGTTEAKLPPYIRNPQQKHRFSPTRGTDMVKGNK